MVTTKNQHKWGMAIDLDKCTGCQACVIACQSENNLPINDEELYIERRAHEWIRIERYWEVPTEYADHPEDAPFDEMKARFIPLMCNHCDNAPCEPVCPVFATYHNDQGLNVQVYNRCVGTRYCANNCPYSVRFFNYWKPEWPESLRNQLNPDVTVRFRGVMEKCTFCVQRIRRAQRKIEDREGGDISDQNLAENNLAPACAMACPTDALVFGDLKDANSRVSRLKNDDRHYRLLESLGTEPSVYYLKKIDSHAEGKGANGHG